MVKLRSHHVKRRGRRSGPGFRLIVILGLAILFISLFLKRLDLREFPRVSSVERTRRIINPAERYFLPVDSRTATIHHRYFSVGYDPAMYSSRWAAYELSRELLAVKNVERSDSFVVDDHAGEDPVLPGEYAGSGYDRGHLIPAADMAFDTLAMIESFLMSNISPQKRYFNRGIWNELENCVRDWAWKFHHIYVVAGPVFEEDAEPIRSGRVRVPRAFFKVVLDLESSPPKSLAFIIPNAISERHLREYAVTVDEVEIATGTDFFAELLGDDLEAKVESEINTNLWPISQERFYLRINKWNKNGW